MSEIRKRIAIIGATSSIAEHCARLWIEKEAVDLILVGRNLAKTEQIAADLRIRNPQSTIRTMETNLLDPNLIGQLVDNIVASGSVNIALIAHGTLPDQALCQQNLTACQDALLVNGISPVLFAEAFAGHMQKANHGVLAIIGSVAGDRGRRSNYVYGAAKGLIERYVQGLRHRLDKTDIKVVLIKPGPTDTPMTAHLKNQGLKLSPVENVAQRIVKAIEQGQSVLYVPHKWQLIMWVIKILPDTVFHKLNI